ncbi:TPA: head completion/stabilization protein [Providencia rettgeri]|nr:head completion/stabilization protein [Providencia rettgeri]
MSSPDFSLSGRKNDYPDIPISNGETFWPSLNVGEFKRQRSLAVSIPDDTLGHALLASMAEINLTLKPVVEYWEARQVTSANDTPGGKMGNETQLTAQYKKAVYARAKADLMGEFAINGRRDTHPALGDDETQNRLLGESAAVIRNMLQLSRVGVYRL